MRGQDRESIIIHDFDVTKDSAEKVAFEEDRAALHLECAGFFSACQRRAEQAENVQAEKARLLAEWESQCVPRKRRRNIPQRPEAPLPFVDGAYTPLARMVRHLDTPEGRLLLTVRVAEVLVLPRLRAEKGRGKDHTSILLGSVLGLGDAVSARFLANFVICWKDSSRWPKRPERVRLLWPGGQEQGSRILGPHHGTLQSYIASLQVRPYRHFCGGQEIVPPSNWYGGVFRPH